MMQVLRSDVDVADLQRSLDQIMVVQRRTEFLERDREIRGLHLSGQRLAKRRADASRTVDVPLVTGNEERCKEGEALNVIPMGVTDQDVAVDRRRSACDQRLAEAVRSGAAIEHHERSARRSQLDARGISPVAHGTRAGLGDRAAGSPKANEHEARFPA